MNGKNNSKDMPVGLAMAMSQSTPALVAFGSMTDAQRAAVIGRAQSAKSSDEMRSIVKDLENNSAGAF